MVRASVKVPWPSISVMAFFFMRKCTPSDPSVGHGAAPVVGGPVVEGHVAGDAELLGLVVKDVGEFGVAQQCLGRDAADVQALASPVLLLDHGDGLAELAARIAAT